MPTLKDNLNSDYLGAFTHLLPKSVAKPIIVYVESEADISFWRNILQHYENSQVRFEIQLPSNTSLSKGKQKALHAGKEIFELMPINNLGKYLIVCIDSDYDYLLQAYLEKAKEINESKYVFQTYSYAIENLKCYAASIHAVCVSATLNDSQKIDFETLLKRYSSIVYELFLWNLYFYSKKEEHHFSMSDFCSIIKILEEPKIDDYITNVGKELLKIEHKVKQKLAEIENIFLNEKNEVKVLADTLKKKGLEAENTYLFIQGHTIFENVVLMLLKPLCRLLKKEHEEKIKMLLIGNEKEMVKNLKHYKNQVGKVEIALANNSAFTQCFLYEYIKQDIHFYIENL